VNERGEIETNVAPKIRGGLTTPGVEGLPEAISPLDPGPGLGDILSVGLLRRNASTKSVIIPES
jgi:hypothetical protein